MRKFLFSIKKQQIATSCFVILLFITFRYLINFVIPDNVDQPSVVTQPTYDYTTEIIINKDTFSTAELRNALLSKKLQRISKSFGDSRDLEAVSPTKTQNFNIHIFYYSWYRSHRIDGYYSHWFFRKDFVEEKNSTFVDSHYFPKLGLYSSRDDGILNIHFLQISQSGVGVILVWWSPEYDLYHLMQIAKRYNLKVALHVAHNKNFPVKRLFKYLKLFIDRYANDTAYYKVKNSKNVELPVFYFHESYLDDSKDWAKYLDERSKYTIRNTSYDGVFIGLLKDKAHMNHVRKARFNGFYTFFASNGHTYGSSWKNWDILGKFASKYNLIFSPSVAPGYIARHDWLHEENIKRDRAHGQYYDVAWRTAINNAKHVSINSFNDWNSGTQIEQANFKVFEGTKYFGYEPKNMDFYLNLTGWWVSEFTRIKNQ